MAAIMTELTYLFAVAAVLIGALVSITVWSPRRVSLKVSALATSVLLLPTAYAGFLHLLSMPKPVDLEWWHARAADATVLGSSLQEEDGIYLWLQLEGVPEPRAYVLPWDRQLAEQLQEAQREAEDEGGELRMRLPFEHSWDDDEPKFYATPHPAMPPKEYDQPPPTRFQPPQPGQEA